VNGILTAPAKAQVSGENGRLQCRSHWCDSSLNSREGRIVTEQFSKVDDLHLKIVHLLNHAKKPQSDAVYR
jgi:hypothetical protein